MQNVSPEPLTRNCEISDDRVRDFINRVYLFDGAEYIGAFPTIHEAKAASREGRARQ